MLSLDCSRQNIQEIPEKILQTTTLQQLYLEGNSITRLPEDFFEKLPNLTWLDLRNNQLQEFPKGVANHTSLEHLFLSNNKLVELPNELGLLPNLKALQVSNNPLKYPHPKIISLGTKFIKKYLTEQLNNKNDSMEEEKHEVECSESKEIKRKIQKMIVHQTDIVTAPPSKIYLKKKTQDTPQNVNKIKFNHNNLVKPKPRFDRSVNAQLKQLWMEKMRNLLNEQERILQQERNLQTLSGWRKKKRNINTKTPANTIPFATYEEFSRIPTREELEKELRNLVVKKKSTKTTTQRKDKNIDEIIADMMKQLQSLELTFSSLCNEKDSQTAQKQIQIISGIHKELQKLRFEDSLTG